MIINRAWNCNNQEVRSENISIVKLQFEFNNTPLNFTLQREEKKYFFLLKLDNYQDKKELEYKHKRKSFFVIWVYYSLIAELV